MKISKSAWHYRFIRFMNTYVPDDLCGYVRALLLSFFLCPVLALFLPVAGLVVAFGWLFSKVAECGAEVWWWLRERRRTRARRDGESLMSAWLQAKKQKLCPLIEFTTESSGGTGNG